MDLKSLQDMPPWDWPDGSAKLFRKVLTDRRADAADRLIAADLAGYDTATLDTFKAVKSKFEHDLALLKGTVRTAKSKL